MRTIVSQRRQSVPQEARKGRGLATGATVNGLVGYPWAHRGKERRGLPGVTCGWRATLTPIGVISTKGSEK